MGIRRSFDRTGLPLLLLGLLLFAFLTAPLVALGVNLTGSAIAATGKEEEEQK